MFGDIYIIMVLRKGCNLLLKCKYQLKIVDTYFGGKAYELRAFNKDGKPTHEKSEWFMSADIGYTDKLEF